MTYEYDSNRPCPCGSGESYGACCRPCLQGATAPTAQALMRSRYVAYLLGDADYIARTWHPSTRPGSVDLSRGPTWTGLQIRNTERGSPGDDEGSVEFVARYIAEGRPGSLHERSRFVREEGLWLYVDGELYETPSEEKVSRNAPCPCGSGRKFKRCCGR
jgi:SEC-C motif-containing protein